MSDWQRVQTLFLASVDLPVEERDSFLHGCCDDDPELLREIQSLLAADEDSGELIETAVRHEAASIFDSKVRDGERMGMYRIVREIGRGGMGSVYLAVRDDDEFRKSVALKIVKRGMDTADVLKRFRYERQILANLEHPYIAHLYDGGTTGDGVPFFVMEYVEGRPVDVFCRENGLDFDARCALFLRILEAVAYAHRNLVVHRDLKPANILITANGTPKLLDFGVAKLLGGDGAGEETHTAGTRPYTPGYASPEQVRGLPITTSTDIYSLGAILYELLIGKRAQPIEVMTPSEIERVVCETEVTRPSLQTRGLSPDLDNIVLMAMRKEPDRRYLSAAEFAEDIRRYLDGRPVLARQDSLQYRLGKFVRRNRLQVAMGTAVAASLIAGLAISIGQTRRADAERVAADAQRAIAVHQTALAEAARAEESRQREIADQQRKLADAQRDDAQQQKAMADGRVKDMLHLAGNTLFEVHDAIAKLPGSVAARKTLVKTTLEYLESLQQQVGMDDEMREALCAAYYKVAMIQGDPQGASLQDFQGAETNLLKAQTLLMPAYDRRPGDPGLMLRLIEVRGGLADLLYRDGHREQAVKAYSDLLPVAHRLALVKVCPMVCQTQEPTIENTIAYELLSIDPARALEHANRGIAEMQELMVLHPNDATLEGGLGSLTAAGAGAYRAMGELEKSGAYYVESIKARENLLQADPNNAALRRNLLIAYGNYATLLGVPWSPNLGRPEQAREVAGKGIALARELVAADPDNMTARRDLGMSLGRLGMIDPGPDGAARSLGELQEAESLIEPIARANPKAPEATNQVALILEYEGKRQEELGRRGEALATYRRSLAMLQPYAGLPNDPVTAQCIADEEDIALLQAASGDAAAAIDMAHKAVAQAETLNQQEPRGDGLTAVLARAWSILAATQSKANRMEEARESAAKAIELWDSIKRPGVLTPHRQVIADVRAIASAKGM
jgi:tetratricopeptide (TPR) repeat protein